MNILPKLSHKNRRVLFNAFTPTQFRVFKPIYEELKKDKRLEIYFMNSLRDTNIFEVLGVPNDRFLKAKIAFFVNWDLYISADIFQPYLLNKFFFRCLGIEKLAHARRPYLVLLPHGISEKKYSFEHDKNRLYGVLKSYDKIFFSSKTQYDRMNGFCPIEVSKTFTYVGYPRILQLINSTVDIVNLKRKIGIKNDWPIILFAPTWGRYGSLEQFGSKIVTQLLSQKANILFKMHDNTYLGFHKEQNNLLPDSALVKAENFHVIKDYDIYPYLHLADFLVADYGSLIFEYLVLEKPAIFLDIDLHNREVVSNLSKLELLRKACVSISSPDQLKEALYLAKNVPHQFSEFRKKLVKEYIESAPNATKNIVESIYALLEKVD